MNKTENWMIYIFFALFLVFFMYPNAAGGTFAYGPHILLGAAWVYVVVKEYKSVQYAAPLLVFTAYLLITSILMLLMRGGWSRSGILEVIRSNLRNFFPFLALSVGVYIGKRVTVRKLSKALMILLIVQATVSILQMFVEKARVFTFTLYRASLLEEYLADFAHVRNRRVIGTIGNPNDLAIVFIVIGVVLFYLARFYMRQKHLRYAQFAIPIFILAMLQLTQSRTGIFVFFIAIFIATLHAIVQKSKSKKALWIILIALVVTAALLIIVTRILPRSLSMSSMTARFEIWARQFNHMRSVANSFLNYIFGIGYHEVRQLGTFDNQYLKVFVGGGAIGVLMLIFTECYLAWLMIKTQKIKEMRLIGLTVICIWVVASLAMNYQEILKVSTLNFLIIGMMLSIRMAEPYQLPGTGNEQNVT